MYGLDGALVGLGWNGQSLAPAGTGAPEQERHHWLDGYCKHGTDGTDGTDGLNGALVGRGWYGRKLSGAVTGTPPWAPEQERHRWHLRGGALYEVVAGTNFFGAARMRSICVGEVK